MDASKAVMEYMLSYFTGENTTMLKHSLIPIIAALKSVHKYPSKADDAGTLERLGKLPAERLLNGINGGTAYSLA